MATRNMVLTDHQSQVVDHLVASGRYQNAGEVLRAGLRMVEEAGNLAPLSNAIEALNKSI